MTENIKNIPPYPFDIERRVPRFEPDDTTFAQPAEIAAPSIVPALPESPVPDVMKGPIMQALNPGRSHGKSISLTMPLPGDINFASMARVSSRICRFTGHTEGETIISVAQHEIEGARAILRNTGRRDWAAAYLIHDGHEYLCGDIATPIAEALAAHAVLVGGDLWYGDIVKKAIKSLKTVLDRAIYEAAGIPWPLDHETARIVREYDVRMLITERNARMLPPPAPWDPHLEAFAPLQGCDLHQYSPGTIEAIWFNMARDLLPVFNK